MKKNKNTETKKNNNTSKPNKTEQTNNKKDNNGSSDKKSRLVVVPYLIHNDWISLIRCQQIFTIFILITKP